jgi:hypothetical protein
LGVGYDLHKWNQLQVRSRQPKRCVQVELQQYRQDQNSSSAPSSMTTLILPETIYTEYVVLDNYLFFDRFHAFLPAPAWFQYGSTNRYITEICKFNLPFSLIVQCYKDRLAIIIVVIEVNK